MILRTRQKTFTFPRKALVVGSVRLSFERARADSSAELLRSLDAARKQALHGADLLAVELYGFPTCPGKSDGILATQLISTFVSSWKTEAHPQPLALHLPSLAVAGAILPMGGDFIINAHTNASREQRFSARLCAEHDAGFIALYKVPSGPNVSCQGGDFDVLTDAWKTFDTSLQDARDARLPETAVALAVRLDWTDAVSTAHSIRLSAQMGRFREFGRPLWLADVPSHTNEGGARDERGERETAGAVARVVHGLMAGVSLFQSGDTGAVAATIRTMSAVLK